MEVICADEKDARDISENNIRMAKESENVVLAPSVAFDAVTNLIQDESKGFYVVAKKNDEVIGQLMITYEWSDWRNNTIWWIQSVYVKRSYRKQGVFQSLYQYVKQLAKTQHVTMLRLYVHKRNIPAISVYESLGLKQKSYVIYETDV